MRQGESIVFGLLECDGRVYTRVVEHVSAEELMEIIRKRTRKGSVYYTDTFNRYNSFTITHRNKNLFKPFIRVYFGYVSH
ncbi:MAG: transposase [Candidatus Moraniibacteriota bacterium]|nr:MAG: transposase [Candidatus Moranbacteria bacterium]